MLDIRGIGWTGRLIGVALFTLVIWKTGWTGALALSLMFVMTQPFKYD